MPTQKKLKSQMKQKDFKQSKLSKISESEESETSESEVYSSSDNNKEVPSTQILRAKQLQLKERNSSDADDKPSNQLS